ncbi:MAG: glycosyltransferase, partial [Patescibacteria group bacterium]|nr:glycosyltransferase [Patescibacteria group bacterium]
MKVVSIGSDRKLFEEGSEVRTRAVAYAARFGELQVVVFSLRGHRLMEKHEGALHIYPTNSRSRLFYIFDAARIARRLQGDIVTTQDPFESGLAGLLARKGRPLHVQLHTDPFAPEFGRGLNVVRRFITRVVLPRAARIRVVLERVAAELRKRYPHIPVSVLPIFVDVEKYKNLERQTHPRFKTALLWVGRFEQEKNPALAIRALADARAAGHEAGLVMLGSGRLEKELRELAQT